MNLTPTWCYDESDLSSSFDDSMNGIGSSDFVSSMFNMRDALSALPICDEPWTANLETSFNRVTRNESVAAEQINGIFETILKVPTSAATKFTEPWLTYLNQGQIYDLSIKCNTDRNTSVKSIIQVRFDDYQMQLQEDVHLNGWWEAHPGERMVNVDFSQSHDYDELYEDSFSPNRIICQWTGSHCTVALGLQCIGTEFTARKHGGEKGIPFRLQVDHFSLEDDTLLESNACQVKVFKMRGAERKHRADREKLDRKSVEFRSLYKPSCSVTRLVCHHPRIMTTTPDLEAGMKSKIQLDECFQSVVSAPSDLLPKLDSDDTVEPEVQSKDDRSSTTKQSDTAEFVAPTQRPIRFRRSSPGPLVFSPSPNRKLSSSTVLGLGMQQPQRRRRTLCTETCAGTCSTCGRGCRHRASRWIVRASKLAKSSSYFYPQHVVDATRCGKQTQTFASHSSGISEKRRAPNCHESDGAIPFPHKMDRMATTSGTVTNRVVSTYCELSTSAESSIGNSEDANRYPRSDHHTNESDSAVCTASDTHAVITVNPTAAPTDQIEIQSDLSGTQSSLDAPIDMLHSIEVTDTHSAAVHHHHHIHINMNSSCVVEWLRASNFENLVDTFKTFTGRDMLRLTKDDFLYLCGAVEGLRLYNAFQNRPTRPRCTLYVSRGEKMFYQALLLYELTRDELLRHLASILCISLEQIHSLCQISPHGVAVILTDELIGQMEDQSCFLVDIRWHSAQKSHVYLQPV